MCIFRALFGREIGKNDLPLAKNCCGVLVKSYLLVSLLEGAPNNYVLFINQLTAHIKNEVRATKAYIFLTELWIFLLSSGNIAGNILLFYYFKEVFCRKTRYSLI